jgi:hypothetical protein
MPVAAPSLRCGSAMVESQVDTLKDEVLLLKLPIMVLYCHSHVCGGLWFRVRVGEFQTYLQPTIANPGT